MTYQELFETFEDIKSPLFIHRRFKHKDIEPILKELPFEKEVVGKSFEKRNIYKVKIGSGKTNVLLWSQMHGNEATATMAMFDIFRFFAQTSNAFTNLIKEHLTLHFVPMLNPDGAERFIRRTSQQIDMNRDAVALVCPESKLLKQLQDELKPAFSFNLHDQSVRYAAGETGNQAAMAFLATAYDKATNWNENRTKAMQVICEMNTILQNLIPNKVGRFSDEFEPRAFGDNIQKWGSSLILVESGGYGDDIEKMYLRKLNYIVILKALESIATATYTQRNLEDYNSIPLNTKCLFDVLIRNAELEGEKMDIGINLDEVNNADATAFEFKSTIEDMGDLSTFWGIKELDANGLKVETLDRFSEKLTSYKLTKEAFGRLEFEKKANFSLTKNGELQHLIVNGEIFPAPEN
jgi:hypothetical protein